MSRCCLQLQSHSQIPTSAAHVSGYLFLWLCRVKTCSDWSHHPRYRCSPQCSLSLRHSCDEWLAALEALGFWGSWILDHQLNSKQKDFHILFYPQAQDSDPRRNACIARWLTPICRLPFTLDPAVSVHSSQTWHYFNCCDFVHVVKSRTAIVAVLCLGIQMQSEPQARAELMWACFWKWKDPCTSAAVYWYLESRPQSSHPSGSRMCSFDISAAESPSSI